LYNTNTNTERYATSDMAQAQETVQLTQRAEKKAARRAAFIQEVAEAVYSLGVQRQNEIEAKRRQRDKATSKAIRLQEAADYANLALISPLEAVYAKNKDIERLYRWEAGKMDLPTFRAKEALRYAIKLGILPEGTPQLPDTAGQLLAYAAWQLAHPEINHDESE
jgi:hypothetical protein